MARQGLTRRFYRAAVTPLLAELREILTHPVQWSRRVGRGLLDALDEHLARIDQGLR